MMNKIICSLLFLFPIAVLSQTLTTKFETSGGKETPVYAEIIAWWQKLDANYAQVKMQAIGMTDAGYPLHLVTVSNDKDFNFESIRKKNKCIILINNGIHPGEPDGIDASMLLVRDIVTKKFTLPDNVVLAIIPVYNIGGCLNRSTHYRVDQNGPAAFGSRGNSQNLDLNRDFIKSDSKDARSFAQIFHLTDPDVFVDNHVSNGADYQHIQTLIISQHSKLGGAMGEFMHKNFEAGMYTLMKKKGLDLLPYVNAFGDTPENGWPEFVDWPRYSTGYATLWNSFAFMPETHMLKTYEQRVKANYLLMQSFIEFSSANNDKIRITRAQQKIENRTRTEFPVNWALDKTKYEEITFKGYESGRKPSDISGLPRLYYDRSKPFEKQVKFYNTYQSSITVKKPVAYIIPQGWWKIIELLKVNQVKMRTITSDTAIEVEVYHIDDYKTSPRVFEMHYLHSDVKVSTKKEIQHFRKGDIYIPMDQDANRFVIEVLEPTAPDSYFAWNFFDSILGQKEGYSSYVFEDTGAEFLKSHPELKIELEKKKSSDTAFAKSAAAQLEYVFKHSPYYEPDHLRYPIYRLVK